MEPWWTAEQYSESGAQVAHRTPSAEEIAEARRRLDGWRERLGALEREWHQDGQWLMMLWGARDPERAVARMADWCVSRVGEGLCVLSRVLEGYEARARASGPRAAAAVGRDEGIEGELDLFAEGADDGE